MGMRYLILLTFLACGFATAAEPPSASDTDPWLGVFLGDAVDGGVELVALVSGGPAARAGLRKGDIVIQAGDFYLADVQDLEAALESLRPGDSVELRLLRAGTPLSSVVELSARPGLAWSTRKPAPAPALPEIPVPQAPLVPMGSRDHGLTLTNVTPDLREHFGAPVDAGVLVTGVNREPSAGPAGVQVGDVIVRVGEIAVRDVVDLDRLLRIEAGSADEVVLSLVRARRPRVVKLAAPAASSATGRQGAAVELALPEPPQETPPAREMLVRSLELEIRRLEQRIDELRREVKALRENR